MPEPKVVILPYNRWRAILLIQKILGGHVPPATIQTWSKWRRPSNVFESSLCARRYNYRATSRVINMHNRRRAAAPSKNLEIVTKTARPVEPDGRVQLINRLHGVNVASRSKGIHTPTHAKHRKKKKEKRGTWQFSSEHTRVGHHEQPRAHARVIFSRRFPFAGDNANEAQIITSAV